MTARSVQIADLRVGLPVEYLGRPEADVVLSETLRGVGMMLYSGHPGVVCDTTVQHVRVCWVGLADEPATYALGFSVNSEQDLTYGVLGLLAPAEFERRGRVIEDSLASGRSLAGWIPPWTRDC